MKTILLIADGRWRDAYAQSGCPLPVGLIAKALEVATLLVEVVLVGGYGELVAGGLVAYYYRLGMHLEHGGCPLVGDVAIDDVLQGTGLVMTVADDEDFLGIHNCTDTDCKRLTWNLAQIAIEETTVGDYRICGQRLYTGAGGEGRSRLVERQMTVGSYSAHKQVDASGCRYQLLIVLALFLKILGIAVEDMDILGLDIYVGEEIVPHKGMVGLGMIYVEVDVFVHIECHYVLERNLA